MFVLVEMSSICCGRLPILISQVESTTLVSMQRFLEEQMVHVRELVA